MKGFLCFDKMKFIYSKILVVSGLLRSCFSVCNTLWSSIVYFSECVGLADVTRHYRGFRPMATYLESVRHADISFLEQLTMENRLSKYDHRPPRGLSVSTSRSRQESCVIDASMDKGPVTRATGGYWTCSKRQFDLIVCLRLSRSVWPVQ